MNRGDAVQAAAERCSMLFLPECCAFIGLNSAEASRDGITTAVLAMPALLSKLS